ncbi:hypothetical protein HPB52_021186 [Rhipicephalus sanguineus]|uniref:F-box domain-containing protein n=1 Tax=Rhipicephalus sanguineus TaxID=34632 RepID=A0A9D4T4X1_RHISA|nr:hypothetical protein HPB52_021186 [Rhipicephalus sanguineus]
MSSTPGASPPGLATPYLIGPFPPDVWVEIFRYMDAESLLNIAEAVPELKSVVFGPTVMKTVTFDPESDERTIEKFVQAARAELIQELRFTNCLTLPSSNILECAGSFPNLRELQCVNCLMDPADLFRHLTLRLACLEKLEWSLYDKVCRNVRATVGNMRWYSKFQRPRLSEVYVEIEVTHSSVVVLNDFLTLCPVLSHLHVQAVRREHYDATSGAAYPRSATPEIHALLFGSGRIPKLETFTYSCELRSSPTSVRAQLERRNGPGLPFCPAD